MFTVEYSFVLLFYYYFWWFFVAFSRLRGSKQRPRTLPPPLTTARRALSDPGLNRTSRGHQLLLATALSGDRCDVGTLWSPGAHIPAQRSILTPRNPRSQQDPHGPRHVLSHSIAQPLYLVLEADGDTIPEKPNMSSPDGEGNTYMEIYDIPLPVRRQPDGGEYEIPVCDRPCALNVTIAEEAKT